VPGLVERSYAVGTRRFRGSLFRSSVVALVLLSLAAGVAASNSNRLRADLRGTNEVPVADLDGRGKASVRIDVEDGEVCFEVSFDRGGTANRGHIHRGVAGVNGGIVVAFFDLEDTLDEDPTDRQDPRLDVLERRNRLSGCVDGLNPELLREIKGNPSAFYVNLHNARFPGGFVRGQLRSGGGGDDDD
jgi:CHRD domain